MTTREMRSTLTRFFGTIQWQLSESDGLVRVEYHRTTSRGMYLWGEFASGATVEKALLAACRRVYEIVNQERIEAVTA
jgi:hypothetical protein